MRVYVAGPVTGVIDDIRPAFEAAAEWLEAAGHRPLVPHWFVTADSSWTGARWLSIETLVKCEGVALLPGWERSRGARLERGIALALGRDVRPLEKWRIK